MLGRYSGLNSSPLPPLSRSHSLWQVQNTCWRCPLGLDDVAWSNFRWEEADWARFSGFFSFQRSNRTLSHQWHTWDLNWKAEMGSLCLRCFIFFILLNLNVRLLNFNNDMVAKKRQRGEIFIISMKKDFNWSNVWIPDSLFKITERDFSPASACTPSSY